MPGRVQFTEDNVKVTGFNFPKLKIAQEGDYARIIALEDPVAGYIHTLRKPRIVNGRPEMQMIKVKRNGVESEEQDYVKDFVSQPLCLGDEGTLTDRGSDPEHCPACAEARRSDMVDLPVRRFAMNVIRYANRMGTGDIVLPFQVQCMVWAFTEKVFGRLVAIKKEVPDNDLRKYDLVLGPLQRPANFQRFDIAAAFKAEWLLADPQHPEDPQYRYKQVQYAWQNQCPDLVEALGRNVPAKFMEDDIQAVRDAWQMAKGYGNQPHFDASQSFDLNQGLAGLQQPAQPQYAQPQYAQPAPAAAPQADPWSLLAGGPQAQPAPAPVQQPMAQPQFQPPVSAPVLDPAAFAQQAPQVAAPIQMPFQPPAPAAFAQPQAQPMQPAPAPQVSTPSVDALAGLVPGQPAPSPTAGLQEFAPQTTLNPDPAAFAQPQAQPAPVQQPAPAAGPVAQPVAQPGTVSKFEDLLSGI